MLTEIITSFFLSKIIVAAIDVMALFLAFIVYRNNHKGLPNRIYVWMTVFMVSWVTFAYIPRLLSDRFYDLGVIFLKIAWFATPLFFVSIYLLSIYLVKNETRFRKRTAIALVVAGALSLLAAFSDKVIAGYEKINGVTTIAYGSWMLLFLAGISFLVAMILAPIFVDRGILKDKKNNFFYIGVFIFLFFNSIFNILLPVYFRDARFYFLGDYSTFVLLVFISISIVRYQLFNIKVIITEILSLFIWAGVFVQIVTANTLEQRLLGIGLLAFVAVFGILLIRSVKKEIKQRETIERIEKDLERAYAVEKRANEELKKLDQYKNQFLMQTQHDLRTPLSTIRGYCDLLLNGAIGRQTKKTLEAVQKIKDVSEDKIKDVNNFLDVSQFQLGKKVVVLKPGVDLKAILEEVRDRLEPAAKNKGIFLKLESGAPSPLISADREKIKSAIFNVVDNSIKYTEKGGVLMSLKNENGKNLVSVEDNGVGMDKDVLENLFKSAFQRGENARELNVTGKGIGIYLSAKIIEAHGGRIWAESEGKGRGSAFYIELPFIK